MRAILIEVLTQYRELQGVRVGGGVGVLWDELVALQKLIPTEQA